MICPSYLSFLLYNPLRKALTDRQRVLDESGITSSSVVLEVGAGNGFITEALAGRAQKVYAVELQAGMVRKLRRRTARFGAKVSIIECDIAACPLERGGADAAMLYYVFHEVRNQTAAAAAIVGALKQGGTIALYEPTLEVGKETFEKTLGLFEAEGCMKEAERHGAFTRFALLRKHRKAA